MTPGRGAAGLPASTRTEQVYDELRRELLDLRFEPGQRLKLLALAERFDASLSVVREALTRLAEQGLLVATPQRGSSVRELSVADLADLTRIRVQVESLALRQAIQNGDVAWEAAVVAAHHTLDRTPVAHATGEFNEDWSAAHRDYHQTLLAGCGSPRLESIVIAPRDSAERYRRWYWALTDDHARDIAGEHRRLRELAVTRDPEPAVAVLTEHLERAPRDLIAYAQQQDLAADPPRRPTKGLPSARSPRTGSSLRSRAARRRSASSLKLGRMGDAELQQRFDTTIANFLSLVEAATHYPGVKRAWVEYLGERPDPAIDRVDVAAAASAAQ